VARNNLSVGAPSVSLPDLRNLTRLREFDGSDYKFSGSVIVGAELFLAPNSLETLKLNRAKQFDSNIFAYSPASQRGELSGQLPAAFNFPYLSHL
jgi:hypothetical protein